jgi:hypothetical protein
VTDSPETNDQPAGSLILGLLGYPLLAFMLRCDVTELDSLLSDGSVRNAEQTKVITTLTTRLSEFADTLADVTPAPFLSWLMEIDETGRTRAAVLRGLDSPEIEAPTSNADDLQRAIVDLAQASYPALLLPSDLPPWVTSDVQFLVEQSDPRFTDIVRELPQSQVFIAAAELDERLIAAFSRSHPQHGRWAAVYLNSGHGGPVFLKDLAGLILRAAWRRAQAKGSTTDEDLAKEALEQLGVSRMVLSGRTAQVVARVAFAGVHLAPGTKLDLGQDGVVRSASEEDRRHAPASVRQQLQGAADAEGNRVTINYDGDVLLEYPYPYKAWIPRPSDDVSSWQEKVPRPADLDRVLLRLRMSLLLAAERQPRVHVVPTWQYVDEPLNSMMGPHSSDPRIGSGLVPALLTETEMAAWKVWYQLLRTENVRRIELALTRVLKAIAERRGLQMFWSTQLSPGRKCSERARGSRPFG